MDAKRFVDAVWAGDFPAVEALIAAGADVNRDHGQGWTPLVHAMDMESDAAWQRHGEPNREATDLTELLVSTGAEPTEDAFRVARVYGNRGALDLLAWYAGRAA